ncbi:MAG TPA: hypothetical protein VKZ92_07335 [Pseudohongiella sp.]|nr:hypothetical protein [Pseudohongiella sp.]
MANNKDNKPRKFFGFEVSDTVTYIIVVILAIIFIRQVMILF